MSSFHIRLDDQTALVTGAGADIGRAVALALAEAGAGVVVADFNPDRVERVAAEITSAGGKALGWQADIANRYQVSAMIETARDHFGRIHMLVNAASARTQHPMLQMDEWDWRRLLEVNLTGTFFCCQLMGRVMADEGGGVIVNIGSTAGHPAPLPVGVGFVASQTGLIGLTKQCAQEYAPLGIRVNAICADNIAETPEQAAAPAHNPQGRWGTPDEVARVALFLCSDAATFITGQAIHVDGGASMV